MEQSNLEHFVRDGQAMVAMPHADWISIQEQLEDAMLSTIAEEARATDTGPNIPYEAAIAILDGVHPLKAYRDLRDLTQSALAELVGVRQPTIARIEARERVGRPALLAKLASVLEMPLETLIDFSQQP